MRITALEGASGGNSYLRTALTEIQEYLTLMANQLGIDPRAAQQVTTSNRVSPPSQVTFTAEGVNGMFVVSIADSVDPANPQGLTIYHQVRTASDLPIEHPDQYDDTPVTPNTHIVIPDPNETKFIGVRSKFLNSRFNNWRALPIAVFSGAVSALSLPSAIEPKQFNTSGFSLLYQDGVTGNIVVSPMTIQYPGQPVFYTGGTITGLTTGLTYYIYIDDGQRLGGDVPFFATTSILDLTANQDRVFIGTIRLVDGGGGLALPPGVRGGAAQGTVIAMASGPDKLIEQLAVGDLVIGIAPISNERVASITPIANVPCFTLTSASGKTITVSSDASLQLGPGSRFPVIEMVVGDEIDTKDGQEQVFTKVFAGLKTVYMVELSFNRFLQGNGVWVGC